MFRALLAQLQEALHKQHLVYSVSVMSADCCHGWSGTLLIFGRRCINKNSYIAWSKNVKLEMH
jgi:hypothetical protein